MKLTKNVAVITLLILSAVSAARLLNQAAQARSTNALETQSQTGSSSLTVAPADRPLLDLPKNWVPFRAKVRIFSPDMGRVDGRMFRSSNGSVRIETGLPEGPVRTIDIKNLTDDTHYLFKRNSWTSAPMQVPNGEAEDLRSGLPTSQT